VKITRGELKKIIKEEATRLLKEGAPPQIHMGISGDEFRRYSPRDDVGTADDVSELQARMDMLPEKYYVVDVVNDISGFREYVQKRGETPNGGQAVVPLITKVSRDGTRTTYFKTAHSNSYGRMEVETEQGLEEGWWEDAKRGVDKVAGTKLSKKSKKLAKDRRANSQARAKEMEDDSEHASMHDPSSMHYDKEAANQRGLDRIQVRKDKDEEEAWADAKGRVAQQDRDSEKERELKDKELKKKISRGTPRGGRRMNMDTFGGAKFEGIDRDELKEIIKKELAKVLQGK